MTHPIAKPFRHAPQCLLAVASVLGAEGCAGTFQQSVVHPSGHEAEVIARIIWIIFTGGAAVLLLVTVLMFYSLYRHHERRAAIRPGAFIFAGGVALPVITLSALLVYTLDASGNLRGVGAQPVDIEIVGHRWWWEVRYVGPEPDQHFKTANEIHLPVGTPMRLRVWSHDVIHSFWVPSLAGKIDLIPGRRNELTLQANVPGVSRGQCAEFCGAQHARMSLYVVAHEPPEYERWRVRQNAPGRAPTRDLARLGQQVFLNGSCAYCHTVRGTDAGGTLGPDLTHIGSRLSIAAGTYPMNRGNLAGWITDAQHLKTDSLMPSFKAFSGEELRALTAYLESLR